MGPDGATPKRRRLRGVYIYLVNHTYIGMYGLADDFTYM